ncbi:MAG: hypothetical protein ABIR33_11225 [Pyrinomonadaceae bacterium]
MHIKTFLPRHGIWLDSTIEFTDVPVDADGEMPLDPTTAKRLK